MHIHQLKMQTSCPKDAATGGDGKIGFIGSEKDIHITQDKICCLLTLKFHPH